MNFSKSITVCCITTMLFLIGCSNAYKLQKKAPLQFTKVSYQEWIAPIKVGSSGVQMHFANLTPEKSITIDSVFFRRMRGKLVATKGKYVSILVKRKPIAEGHIIMTKGPFPFKILNNECVVSYIENGVTKYFKIGNVIEHEGVFYDEGHPEQL